MAEESLRAESASSNVLPFPVHRLAEDRSRKFLRAVVAAEIAQARYQLTNCLCGQAQLDGDAKAIDRARDAHWDAFDALVEAVDRLAATPATSRVQLDRKRMAIGTIWLKAEGERYDRLRAAVAADGARLTCRGRGPMRPR